MKSNETKLTEMRRNVINAAAVLASVFNNWPRPSSYFGLMILALASLSASKVFLV